MRAIFLGTKKTNKYGIPNGCNGIVKQFRDGHYLIQWDRIGLTTWVKPSEVEIY